MPSTFENSSGSGCAGGGGGPGGGGGGLGAGLLQGPGVLAPETQPTVAGLVMEQPSGACLQQRSGPPHAVPPITYLPALTTQKQFGMADVR